MLEPTRILIAEDRFTDADLAEREIKKTLEACVFQRVETREEFLQALETFQPDLIISDYQMPQFDGLTALKLALEHAPSTPLIIITGALNEDTAVECIKAGAVDYVIKEHLKRLGQAVLHALEEKKLRLERHQAEQARRASEARYRSRTEELEVLFKLSYQLSQAQTAQAMLPVVLEEVEQVLKTDGAAIAQYDVAREQFQLVSSKGNMRLETGLVFRTCSQIYEQVFLKNEPWVISDFASEMNVIGPNARHMQNIGPAVFIPLHSGETKIGVLSAVRRRVTDARPAEVYTPEEIRLLVAMGEITGNALARAQLFDDVQGHLARTKVLHDIQLAIANSFDLQYTLNATLANAVAYLRVDAATVMLNIPDTHILECAAEQGFKRMRMVGRIQPLGEGLAGQAAIKQRLVYFPDLSDLQEVPEVRNFIAEEGFVSYYGICLRTKGLVKGVIEIFHRVPLCLSEENLEFLQDLSGQVAVAVENIGLFTDLQHSNLQLALAYDATIDGLTRALDLRDRETEDHTRRVIDLTLQFARAVGINTSDLVHVRRGAYLHDIGKIGVPDAILLKTDTLTDEEWVVMRRHPQYAFDMLYPVDYLRPALDIPYCHHEKWNGTGYPRGLRGNEIPLAARLFAVVDVWDALTHERPYRKAWTENQAIDYLQAQTGKHFDPQLVEVFLKIISGTNGSA